MVVIPGTSVPSGRRAAALGVALAAALVLGIVLLRLTPDATRLPPGGRAVPVLVVVIGWSFVALGCAAWLRRADTAMGALLTMFGFAVLVSGLYVSEDPAPYLASTIADPIAVAVFVHLLLAFPSGRLGGRAAQLVVAGGYVTLGVTELASLLFDADPDCTDCPRNVLLLTHDDTIASVARTTQDLATVAVGILAVVLTLRRRRDAGPLERRSLAPLLGAGAAVLALGALSSATQNAGLDDDVQQLAQLVFIAAFAGLPAAFLIGLVRSRFFAATAVTGLLERFAAEPGSAGGALAAAVEDPTLTVAYWVPEQEAYVDRDGRPVAVPEDATEIVHRGRRIGAVTHGGALEPSVLHAAALALDNERLEVELRARVEALRRSRARLVETGDRERRRLTRDLHDGAQQRLVSVLIDLELARERWRSDPDGALELITRAREDAAAAVGDLRDLASGLHPAVLSQRGLDAAVESLAARSPVPVELDVVLAERPPLAVETAAYFVIAEALTNVAKHARATHARVTIRQESGLLVEIDDDGAGGAQLAGGTGLLGLADRVGALDGTLAVHSPSGEGTLVRARFP